MISIRLTSVMIDDQARALDFYTNVLGFAVRRDIPMGTPRPIKKRFPVAHDGVKNVGMTGAPLPVLAGKERLDAVER